MESARKYTSVSMDAYSRTRSVSTMSAKDFMDSLNNAYQCIHENANKNADKTNEDSKKSDSDTQSENAESSLEFLKGKFGEIKTAKISPAAKQDEDLRSAIRYMCLNFLLMLLFGKGIEEMKKMSGLSFGGGLGFDDSMDLSDLGTLSIVETTDTVSYERYEAETENTSFSASGIVKTADGRELNFDIDMSMSRSFESYIKETGVCQSLEMRLMDPLVINLDTCAAEVSDQKFFFDLDSDGIDDEVSMLGSKSGFLALDLNGDGEINNGSELFGTKSGDGFKDLAKYDKDHNGWIDEADEVFDQLKIFSVNEDGTKSLYTLKDKGVGAIYLGNTDTDFTITNQENKVNAQVRKTGLFLYEEGTVGTVQHVDLAVELGA